MTGMYKNLGIWICILNSSKQWYLWYFQDLSATYPPRNNCLVSHDFLSSIHLVREVLGIEQAHQLSSLTLIPALDKTSPYS